MSVEVLFVVFYTKMLNQLGEPVNKSSFDPNLLTKAENYLREKVEFERTVEFQSRSTEPISLMFISIMNQHAAVVIMPMVEFKTYLPNFNPIFGYMLNCKKLWEVLPGFSSRMLLNDCFLPIFHLQLIEGHYALSKSYVEASTVLSKARLFFIGNTAMGETSLSLLALMKCPSKYRLMKADCLEFVKSFCWITKAENGYVEAEIHRFFNTLRVMEENDSLATSESRNQEPFAETSATAYFLSFKPDRLVFLILIVVSVIVAAKLIK